MNPSHQYAEVGFHDIEKRLVHENSGSIVPLLEDPVYVLETFMLSLPSSYCGVEGY